MRKSRFNKSKCKKCKYHGRLHGVGHNTIHCNYSSINQKSTLQRINNKIVDTRGADYNNCLLYESGKSKRDKADWKEVRGIVI